MKKLITVLIIITALSASSQNVKRPNENADAQKSNSVGINISPVLHSLLGDCEQSILKLSSEYKHYSERYNFRFGLTVTPNINTFVNFIRYNEDGTKTKLNIIENGEIVEITDEIVIKRYDLHKNIMIEINTGLEKAKKTKVGTWILGAELNLGYFRKNESYLYRQYENTDDNNT